MVSVRLGPDGGKAPSLLKAISCVQSKKVGNWELSNASQRNVSESFRLDFTVDCLFFLDDADDVDDFE